jgi:Mn2+/Fe2+ NRAMP family transporter
MGELVNRRATTGVLAAILALIALLNIVLIVQTVRGG